MADGAQPEAARAGQARPGQAITAYRPPGARGQTGVDTLGGEPTGVGSPVTHKDIVEGRIPAEKGFCPGDADQMRRQQACD